MDLADGLGRVVISGVMAAVLIVVILPTALMIVRRKARGIGLAPAGTDVGRRQRDPNAGTWGPGIVVDPAQQVVVRPLVPSYGNLGGIAARSAQETMVWQAQWQFDPFRRNGLPSPVDEITGRQTMPMEAGMRETGSTYIFDPMGIRLQWPGGLNFAVRWSELSSVTLQVVTGQESGIEMMRVAMIPPDAQRFAAAHPELQSLYAADSTPPTWLASLGALRGTGTGPMTFPDGQRWRPAQADPQQLQAAFQGLQYARERYAGFQHLIQPPGAGVPAYLAPEVPAGPPAQQRPATPYDPPPGY